MTQLERIAAMEAAYDRVRTGKPLPDDLQILTAYMDSGDWLRDYEADEAGLIPQCMKRGVLSQDGLYNLITDWKASHHIHS